jgi:hypothetical protein
VIFKLKSPKHKKHLGQRMNTDCKDCNKNSLTEKTNLVKKETKNGSKKHLDGQSSVKVWIEKHY